MSLKALKADLSLAKFKHQAKPSEATQAMLDKAQKAYDEAISGQESNGSDADVKPVDTKADREPAIKSISQLVLAMSEADFSELEKAISEALRGPEYARRIPVTSVSPFVCPLCGRSFPAEASGDAGDNARAEEPEGSGEPAGEPSAEVGDDSAENADSNEPATTQPATTVVSAPEAPAAKPASAAKKPTGAAKSKAATEEKKTEPQS